MSEPLRLLGVWIINPNTLSSQAVTEARAALASMCADHDVLPAGNHATVIFGNRRETHDAADHLDLPVARVLDLAEKLGYAPRRMFIAAACDVRPVGMLHRLASA